MINVNKDELLQVGAITSAHGIRGEIKVFPTTDDPSRFKKLKSVLLDNEKDITEYEIESVKFFKQFVILKLKGIDDRDIAERLRRSSLLVTRENAVKLKKDEYFIADLIGLSVYEENELVGSVRDVIQTGANDVYEIALDADFMIKRDTKSVDEILLPAIKECIKSVDVEGGRIDVKIMPGLI